MPPIEMRESPVYGKEMKLITATGIPGLKLFGLSTTSQALAPLGEHYHRDCFEFSYLAEGSVRFTVGDTDYPMSGGDLFVTLPNQVHSTGNSPLSLHTMYWFQLEADGQEAPLFLSPEAGRWLLEALTSLPCRRIRLHHNPESSLRDILEGISGGTELGRYTAAQKLAVLLYELVADARQQNPRLTADIQRSVDYIHAHIEEKLPLQLLARTALLSESRFKEKFKSQTGFSPRNYVNYCKVEAAKEALRAGVSATETAMSLGFSGSDYFSTVFRRYTLSTPTEYARKCREKT